MTNALTLASAVLAGAIVWFVLDVILGVAVWISFVAGGATLVAALILGLAGVGMRHSHSTGNSRKPGSPVGAS
jgi:hypothetical protein